jgi:hypothetical protein
MAHGQPFGKDALLESPGTAQHNWTADHQSIQRIRFTLRPQTMLVKNRRLSLTLITALFLQ